MFDQHFEKFFMPRRSKWISGLLRHSSVRRFCIETAAWYKHNHNSHDFHQEHSLLILNCLSQCTPNTYVITKKSNDFFQVTSNHKPISIFCEYLIQVENCQGLRKGFKILRNLEM